MIDSPADAIVVGIDFGTTYSAVAFSYESEVKDIDVIEEWQASNAFTSQKVPTQISYPTTQSVKSEATGTSSDLFSSFGITDTTAPSSNIKDIKWGFQIEHHESRISYIKLFLDKDQKLPSFVSVSDIADQLRKSGRSVEDVVADYLAKVYEHIETTLRKRYVKALLDVTPIHYVLTVPAVWSDRAKRVTLSAANRAGFGEDLEVITEPEAAACYALRASETRFFATGSRVVVCDAGGGTVDLISYCIASTSPLKLKESTVGTGDIAGAALLDLQFLGLIEEIMGKAVYESLKVRKPRAMQTAVKYFEAHVKRQFNSARIDDFSVPCPGMPDNEEVGICDGYITLTCAQVKIIFDPIIEKVLKLIDGQVSKIVDDGLEVSAILLVGGFGQSQYLCERVEERFGRKKAIKDADGEDKKDVKSTIFNTKKREFSEVSTNSVIEILQPRNAWTAVVRGAVIRGREGNLVLGRRSRLNYGTAAPDYFDVNKHPRKHRFYDSTEGCFKTRNVMRWFVRKDDEIADTTTVTLDFHKVWTGKRFPNGNLLEVSHEIYSNEDDAAPAIYREESMPCVCKIFTDLNRVPREEFEDDLQNTKGKNYWRLNYQLEVKFDTARANLEVTLKIGRQEYGKEKVLLGKD